MPALTHFLIFTQHQHRTIPPEIGNLTQLKCLYLSHAGKLTGTLPTEMSKLIHMQGLFLRWNHFEGALPDLSKMRNLTKLVIDGAPVKACPVSMIVAEAKKSRVCCSCCLMSSGVDHEREQEQWHTIFN